MFFSRNNSSKNAVHEQQNQPLNEQTVVEWLSDYLNIKKTSLIGCKIHNGTIELTLPIVCKDQYSDISQELINIGWVKETTDIRFSQNIPMMQTTKPLVTNVKNIIAVASGKGGVGKSATSVNLAYALKQQGARVGLLDADIYGPSVPIMLGEQDNAPESHDNKHMIPIQAHGIVSNSIGYLVKNDHASIWRGPMASKALQQLVNETNWPLLDYLIVDMPPGTGDIQLTMAQQLPLTAAVVVTTPQDLATADAEKGIAMFEKLQIPILGLVENMSGFVCPNCQHVTDIFAGAGADGLAERYQYQVLAKIPIDTSIRECTDNGKNLIELHPEKEVSKSYSQAAVSVSVQLINTVEVSSLAAANSTRIDVTQL